MVHRAHSSLAGGLSEPQSEAPRLTPNRVGVIPGPIPPRPSARFNQAIQARVRSLFSFSSLSLPCRIRTPSPVSLLARTIETGDYACQ